MKKKLFLLPIVSCITATAFIPSITSCSEAGWIGWNYKKKGVYVNDKIQPLTYQEGINPEQTAFDWIAQNKNNLAYDYLLAMSSKIDEKTQIHRSNINFHIDSFDPIMKMCSFKIKTDIDTYREDGDTFEWILTDADLVIKNVSLAMFQEKRESNNFTLCWILGSAIHMPQLHDNDIKAFLESEESGNWSITGRYSYHAQMTISSLNKQSSMVILMRDENCNYNKTTLNEIYENKDNDTRWLCLKNSYDILCHEMYYLQNYNIEE